MAQKQVCIFRGYPASPRQGHIHSRNNPNAVTTVVLSLVLPSRSVLTNQLARSSNQLIHIINQEGIFASTDDQRAFPTDSTNKKFHASKLSISGIDKDLLLEVPCLLGGMRNTCVILKINVQKYMDRWSDGAHFNVPHPSAGYKMATMVSVST